MGFLDNLVFNAANFNYRQHKKVEQTKALGYYRCSEVFNSPVETGMLAITWLISAVWTVSPDNSRFKETQEFICVTCHRGTQIYS